VHERCSLSKFCNSVDTRSSAVRATFVRCLINDHGEVKVDSGDEKPKFTCFLDTNATMNESGWLQFNHQFNRDKSLCTNSLDPVSMYKEFERNGLSYGPSFRLIESMSASPDTSIIVSKLRVEKNNYETFYLLPPPLLDALIHATGYAIRSIGEVRIATVESMKLLWSSGYCWSHIELRSKSIFESVIDCTLLAERGESLVRYENCVVQPIGLQASTSSLGANYSKENANALALASKWVHLQPTGDLPSCAEPRHCLIIGERSLSQTINEILPSFEVHCEDFQNLLSSPVDIFSGHLSIYYYVVVVLKREQYPFCFLWMDDSGGKMTLSSWLQVLRVLYTSSSRLVFVLDVDESCAYNPDIGITSLIGAIRSAQLEYPLVQTLVLSHDNEIKLADAIVSELSIWDGELEVHYSEGKRKVRRYAEDKQYPSIGNSLHGTLSVAEGCYLITGGTGALGLIAGRVLIQLGVKRIILLSRSGRIPYDGQGLETILGALLDADVDVRVVRCDVSNENSLVASLETIRSIDGWSAGIEGIIHCAGVLNDALIRGGGAERGCDDVWEAKARSAYFLHNHTLQDPVRTFVCYSSMAAAIGNIGQSAYGAANSYLDGLVMYRVRNGLPGLSIRWPAISGIGMAAQLDSLQEMALSIDDVENVILSFFVSILLMSPFAQ